MSIRGKRDLLGLREAGRVVRACLSKMERHVRPGVTTAELNGIGAEVMRRCGARSAPMLVYKFPAEVCISVNDELVHGIPSGRVVREGDLVKLDVTVEKDGYMADAAVTIGAGELDETAAALIACAERAFRRAMAVIRPGAPLNAIGREVESEVKGAGFSVARELTGHGIGRTIHEAPTVRNYHEPRERRTLSRGLVLAIEPVIAAGSGSSVTAPDGWTVRTSDGSPAAHYEQTIVITDAGPLVLTAAD